MYVLALTGGIGAGKTTAAEYFRGRGAVVISLDQIARAQLSRGRPVYQRVVEEFGTDVTDSSGALDPTALARVAFASKERTHALNALVHQAVILEVEERLAAIRASEHLPRAVVLEVPLLVEAPALVALATGVLTVSASSDIRVARLIQRGMTEADARSRIACQATDQEREALASRVIVNEGTKAEFLRALERIWDEVAGGGP